MNDSIYLKEYTCRGG